MIALRLRNRYHDTIRELLEGVVYAHEMLQ